MRKQILLAIFGIGVALAGASKVRAAISYGNGYYVNLCDSGTSATAYTCDKRCNPLVGTCTSDNNGAVKWTCNGKWDQCLETESGWSNSQQLGNPGCGKTVQLSLFDKSCRREDGTWDSSCQLLGYMVWYSGDCPGTITTTSENPTPTASVNLAISSTPTPGITVNPSPSLTPSPIPTQTIIPTPTTDIADTTETPAATSEAVSKTTPRTGLSIWWGAAGLTILGAAGFKMRKWSKTIWS